MHLFIIILLLFASCATTSIDKPSEISKQLFEKHYTAYDIDVHWTTYLSDHTIKVDGNVKNNYVYTIRNLEITAKGLDEGDVPLCMGNFDFFPEEIPPNEQKSFNINFSCKKKPAKVKFYYRYYFIGDRGLSEINFGSFE